MAAKRSGIWLLFCVESRMSDKARVYADREISSVFVTKVDKKKRGNPRIYVRIHEGAKLPQRQMLLEEKNFARVYLPYLRCCAMLREKSEK